jgi:hypothetical protein
MAPASISALAVHVCADVETTGLRRRWPAALAAQDTTSRVARICQGLGILEQQTLAGGEATAERLLAALARAAATLAEDGLLVLTFSGHTERGDGPIETARWCLVDRGLELSQIAGALARLPAGVRLVIICDTCYAAAITQALVGAHEAVVLGSCGDDQTMIDRLNSEFIVRLEAFVCAPPAHRSLAALRRLLEADTPDCERPFVWTSAADRWSADATAFLGTRSSDAARSPSESHRHASLDT